MGQPWRGIKVEGLEAAAYTVPTDAPESDGTLEWSSTTMVVVHARGGGQTGMGYTYTGSAATAVVREQLAPAVCTGSPIDVPQAWAAMVRAVRNLGLPGVAATAISAVDVALWDLKARVLGVPLSVLLGLARDRVPIYGSGGFTSYSQDRLCEQLAGWTERGIPRVKMKVGRDAAADAERVIAARRAIGDEAELFVDANGAYTRPQAVSMAEWFAGEAGVDWFEEPRPSDDLEGLRFVHERAPAGMDIAAGEYGYQPLYFRRMLEAGAVDVLQADVTRALGITGFLAAGDLCETFGIDLSAHCAPAVSVQACAAAKRVRHLEYFHDHVRVEGMLLDGVPQVREGTLRPDLSRPGHGLELKRQDAERFSVR